MKIKISAIICLLSISIISMCQSGEEINRTDQNGKKQGSWIKKYPDGTIQYEGIFRDDHPVGEFRRYNDNNTLKSVLVYSDDGLTADATFYHPNGFVASKGKYTNQLKEGKWKFYSELTDGYMVSEEGFTKDKPDGPSVKYFPDGKIAEQLTYADGVKNGEWIQFYESGKIFMKTAFNKGILDGTLEVWFENGNPKFTGLYRNNLREGKWLVYNEDGILKYEINYIKGVTDKDPMEIETAAFFESLEKNKNKITDPEKNR